MFSLGFPLHSGGAAVVAVTAAAGYIVDAVADVAVRTVGGGGCVPPS